MNINLTFKFVSKINTSIKVSDGQKINIHYLRSYCGIKISENKVVPVTPFFFLNQVSEERSFEMLSLSCHLAHM